MAQQHHDSLPSPPSPAFAARACTADRTAGETLTAYVGGHAGEFLRALRLRDEDEATAIRLLRRSARRMSAALDTYGPLVEAAWAEQLRTELDWLNATLSREQRYAAQLTRLHSALGRLASDGNGPPGAGGGPGPVGAAARGGGSGAGARGTTAVGAARAGALLERQLTLARTRAHSATLQAFGSARFHAVADAVTLLASELPLTASAAAPARKALTPLAERAHRRLADAAEALPLPTAAHPYNSYALRSALADIPTEADEAQDAPWHRTRQLVRLSRYALEVLDAPAPPDGDPASGSDDASRLHGAARALDRHREAADAATAAAAAARTPRITPATAYALGVLHADQRCEVEAARYAFSRLWRGVVPAPAAVATP